MVAENPGPQGNGVPGGNGPVGPNLQGQLVKVGQILYAGVFHRIVDLFDRGIDRVHGDHPDHRLGGLVPVCGDITSAVGQGQFHIQNRLRPQRCDGMLGVKDLHLAVSFDITGSDNPLAGGLNVHCFGTLAVQLGNDPLYVQDDFCYVLFHTGDRAELMLHPCNLDAGDCSAGQRGQQNPAKRVA